jgi:tetratricopeptide (TPR) repeat protein
MVRDDVRAAMEWGLQTRQPELLAFVRPLVFYSWTRSQLHEIAQWVAAALVALPEATPMRIRALLEYARLLGHYTGDEPLSEAFAREAIRIQEQLGDFSFRSMAGVVMAGCYMDLGDLDRAVEVLEEAIEWGRKLDDPRQLSLALNDSAYLKYQMGVRTSEPEERVREAISLARLHGERYESTAYLDTLAEITLDRDQVAEAATLWSECLEVGDLYDDIWSTAMAIQGAAAIARSARDYEAAVLLSSAAAHLREDTRWVLSSSNSLPSATLVKELRKKLSATRFEELWAAGLRLTRSEAVLEARSALNRSALAAADG